MVYAAAWPVPPCPMLCSIDCEPVRITTWLGVSDENICEDFQEDFLIDLKP